MLTRCTIHIDGPTIKFRTSELDDHESSVILCILYYSVTLFFRTVYFFRGRPKHKKIKLSDRDKGPRRIRLLRLGLAPGWWHNKIWPTVKMLDI